MGSDDPSDPDFTIVNTTDGKPAGIVMPGPLGDKLPINIKRVLKNFFNQETQADDDFIITRRVFKRLVRKSKGGGLTKTKQLLKKLRRGRR